MVKIAPSQQIFFQVAAGILIFVLVMNLTKAESASQGLVCNGTRIADCLLEQDALLMESESSRRILLVGRKGGTITPPSLAAPRPFCPEPLYSKCIQLSGQSHQMRKCGFINSCNRTP